MAAEAPPQAELCTGHSPELLVDEYLEEELSASRRANFELERCAASRAVREGMARGVAAATCGTLHPVQFRGEHRRGSCILVACHRREATAEQRCGVSGRPRTPALALSWHP